jgi:hypothetical protein
MFWLPFGTAAAVIGLALMTIGVSRSAANANLLGSVWFDAGLGLLAIGAALLLWALWLFLSHRKTAHAPKPTTVAPADKAEDPMVEAVRAYYHEREKAIDMWDKRNDVGRPKPKT